MKKGVLLAVLLALAAFAGWYVLSPGMAMQGLKEAALAGDREELKERVDFPAIRESLKSQLRAHMAAEMAKEKDTNPFAGIGMLLANAIIDPLIDGVISPDGIKAIVENGRMKRADGAAENAEESPEKPIEWAIERRGLDKFTAHPEVPEGDAAPVLVFRRDGLGWDLVDIEVPSNSGGQQPAKID